MSFYSILGEWVVGMSLRFPSWTRETNVATLAPLSVFYFLVVSCWESEVSWTIMDFPDRVDAFNCDQCFVRIGQRERTSQLPSMLFHADLPISSFFDWIAVNCTGNGRTSSLSLSLSRRVLIHVLRIDVLKISHRDWKDRKYHVYT